MVVHKRLVAQGILAQVDLLDLMDSGVKMELMELVRVVSIYMPIVLLMVHLVM